MSQEVAGEEDARLRRSLLVSLCCVKDVAHRARNYVTFGEASVESVFANIRAMTPVSDKDW